MVNSHGWEEGNESQVSVCQWIIHTALENIKSLSSSPATSSFSFPPLSTDYFNTDTFSNEVKKIYIIHLSGDFVVLGETGTVCCCKIK